MKGQQPTPKHLRYKFNIMIDQILPKVYDESLWQVIHSISPSQFLKIQEDIQNILLTDLKLFQTFFKRFYMNHIQLHNWYMLAKQNQLDIKQYIFKNLIDKTYKQYKQMVKEEQIKRNYAKQNEILKGGEEKSKQKKYQSFHKILLPNTINHKGINQTNLYDQQKEKKKQVQFENTLLEYSRQDYHQLFLKTFNACDGNKYIYYDFDKHMKGMEQKKRYNNFIRIKKHKIHNSIAFKEQNQNTINSHKQSSCSTHFNQPSTYFHEEEENFQKMLYCSYNVKPIGEIQTNHQSKDKSCTKKLPNVFRKFKNHHQSSKLFVLRKKKIF